MSCDVCMYMTNFSMWQVTFLSSVASETVELKSSQVPRIKLWIFTFLQSMDTLNCKTIFMSGLRGGDVAGVTARRDVS